MATTTNNGWTTPDNTALVKDGASAIRTLGQAIDTTLGVYQSPGLVKINTTTFSAVASQSLPTGTFTSAYTNYRLIMRVVPSTSLSVNFRMRVSGVDDSSNNYNMQYVRGEGVTASAASSTATSGNLTNKAGSSFLFCSADIFSPNVATNTFLTMLDTGTQAVHISSINHNVSTAYDSMTLIASTGNITGSVSIYGYNV